MLHNNAKRTIFVCLIAVQIGGLLAVSLNKEEDVVNVKDLLKETPLGRSLMDNCEGLFNPTCLKLRFVNFLEKYSKANDYEVYPGVKLVKEKEASEEVTAETLKEISRNFPDDVSKRVDSYLLYKIASFIDSHSVTVKLNGDQNARSLMETETEDDDDEFEEEDTNDVGEGRRRRRRKKKVKKVFGLVAAVLLVKKVLKALAIGLLFLVAGKALVTSLVALVLSGVVGFKTLLSKNNDSPTVISGHGHEQYDHGHGHESWGGYARSIDIQLPEHLKKE